MWTTIHSTYNMPCELKIDFIQTTYFQYRNTLPLPLSCLVQQQIQVQVQVQVYGHGQGQWQAFLAYNNSQLPPRPSNRGVDNRPSWMTMSRETGRDNSVRFSDTPTDGQREEDRLWGFSANTTSTTLSMILDLTIDYRYWIMLWYEHIQWY